MPDDRGGADVIITEIKCIINAMHLNHPQTISPSPGHGKIVFHETGPWCLKGWRLLTCDLASSVCNKEREIENSWTVN